MKINDIKFLPKANAFSDVYGKATGMPFVGEMMVAAAGQETQPTPDPDPDPDPTPDPEPQYVLQSLTASADCDEDLGEFTPYIEAVILSPDSWDDVGMMYSWYHDDGNGNEQSFPNDPDNDDNSMIFDSEELITDQNYEGLGVSSDYIGWYWWVFYKDCATLFYAEHAEDTAEYTISIDNGEGGMPIGSADIEVDYPDGCSEACDGEEEQNLFNAKVINKGGNHYDFEAESTEQAYNDGLSGRAYVYYINGEHNVLGFTATLSPDPERDCVFVGSNDDNVDSDFAEYVQGGGHFDGVFYDNGNEVGGFSGEWSYEDQQN